MRQDLDTDRFSIVVERQSEDFAYWMDESPEGWERFTSRNCRGTERRFFDEYEGT